MPKDKKSPLRRKKSANKETQRISTATKGGTKWPPVSSDITPNPQSTDKENQSNSNSELGTLT